MYIRYCSILDSRYIIDYVFMILRHAARCMTERGGRYCSTAD